MITRRSFVEAVALAGFSPGLAKRVRAAAIGLDLPSELPSGLRNLMDELRRQDGRN